MSADTPEALAQSFAAAMRDGDVRRASAMWIEDASIVGADGQSVQGREAIGTALSALVGNGASLDLQVDRLFTAGDAALVLGTLTITGADGDGHPYRQQSSSAVVYSRGSDGRWRIAIDAPWGLPD